MRYDITQRTRPNRPMQGARQSAFLFLSLKLAFELSVRQVGFTAEARSLRRGSGISQVPARCGASAMNWPHTLNLILLYTTPVPAFHPAQCFGFKSKKPESASVKKVESFGARPTLTMRDPPDAFGQRARAFGKSQVNALRPGGGSK